ncbi:MAG: hypothetical protein AAF850_02495 [Pseudomonadota bacterium]
MLLRRLTNHINDQNWFAVGLDFFIVVVGVFIGIQLGNWNEQRQERQLEGSILARLADDFYRIEEDAEQAIQFSQSRMNILDRLMVAISDDPANVLDPEIGRRLLWGVTVKNPVRDSPTYGELLSAGEMRLIKSPELRDALSMHARNRTDHFASNQRNASRALSTDSDLVRVANLSEAQRDAAQNDKPAAYQERLEKDLLSLAGSASLLTDLAVARGTQRYAFWMHSRTLNDARRVLILLGEDVPEPKFIPDRRDPPKELAEN